MLILEQNVHHQLLTIMAGSTTRQDHSARFNNGLTAIAGVVYRQTIILRIGLQNQSQIPVDILANETQR